MFCIPEGPGKAFCDRIICQLAELIPIDPDQAEIASEPESALKLQPRYFLGRIEESMPTAGSFLRQMATIAI